MATNTLLTITMVTRRLLQILKNNIVFSAGVNRMYEDQFAISGAKIGDTLNIRKPSKFTVGTGASITPQNYVEETVPLVIAYQKHCAVEFSSREMTLSLDDWSRRIGEPEAVKLANEVDRDGLGLYWQVANSILSPDPSPTTSKWDTYMEAGAMLDDEGTPRDNDRTIVMGPWEQARVVSENKGLFQASTEIAEQYRKGEMGTSAGAVWKMDQNVHAHTTGARGGTPTMSATAGQTGSSIATIAWTAAAAVRVKKGDVFTIAGVNAVNPQSLQDTGKLRQFTATSDASSDASGNATINIYPPIIIAPDPRQTVTAAPAGSAPLTFLGTASTRYIQNLLYHKNAFTLAMVDLVQPNSGTFARVTDPDNGFSMRSWKDSNIMTDTHPARVDLLYGWTTLRPEMAVRVWSTQ